MKKKINFKEVFPNFITILGLCLGISSIKFAFELNFEKSIYLDLLSNHFYLSENDTFLGGCFIVKNERTLKCKLKSYYNVYKNKLPLSCN